MDKNKRLGEILGNSSKPILVFYALHVYNGINSEESLGHEVKRMMQDAEDNSGVKPLKYHYMAAMCILGVDALPKFHRCIVKEKYVTDVFDKDATFSLG